MKAPAQPSHHEANPRRENGIGATPARFEIDSSLLYWLQCFIDGSYCPGPAHVHTGAIQTSAKRHRPISKRYGEYARIVWMIAWMP